jgi:hypothetical protein
MWPYLFGTGWEWDMLLSSGIMAAIIASMVHAVSV